MTFDKKYFEENEPRFLAELFSLIRIPSISAKPSHKADMTRCAERYEQTAEDFIIVNPEVEAHAEAAVEALNHGKKKRERRSPMYCNDSETKQKSNNETTPQTEAADNLDLDDSEFDLSHISTREQSREDIIAAAEAAAFGNKE